MARPEIVYLTCPMPVAMGDPWFEIAVPDHFWMVRRFDVLRRLAAEVLARGGCLAEIGCGNGVLQVQLEEHLRLPVDGFDLNERALQMSIAKHSSRFCYNILERRAELFEKYDVIFLFDIVEHIADEDSFLESVLHHLAPGGCLVVNVPALPSLFSAYDRAAGHVRRYTVHSLVSLAAHHRLTVERITYWGLPMVPLLFIRKFLLGLRARSEHQTLHQGFKPPSAGWNRILGLLARLEPLPQTLLGSSVMAVIRKPASP